MKRHNVCKRHVAIDTDFKQYLNVPFSPLISSMGFKLQLLSSAFLKELCHLSVNFGTHISQDSHKNQYPGPVCNFALLHHNTVTNVDQICRSSVVSFSLVIHTQKLLDHVTCAIILFILWLVGLFGTSYHVLALKHNDMTQSLYQRMQES